MLGEQAHLKIPNTANTRPSLTYVIHGQDCQRVQNCIKKKPGKKSQKQTKT